MPSPTPEITTTQARPGWANRLVAKWCDGQAQASDGRKLVTRCRHAYKNGPLVEPTRKFADALQATLDRNEKDFKALAVALRAEADRQDQEYLVGQRD